MHLKHLSLTNYRNYTRLELDIPARVHVLQGDNAQGKTNLLEVVYYLATTKSPLASSDREFISWDADREPIPFVRIDATFARREGEHTISVTLVKETRSNGGESTTTYRRQIRLDGAPRRAIDVVGQFKAVLFLPEDVQLVSGSPSARRRYLDITLCQIEPSYCRDLSRYNRVITQRNALLKRIRDGHAREDELPYWDEQMIGLSSRILAQRLRAIAKLEMDGRDIHSAVTDGKERSSLSYVSRAWDLAGTSYRSDEAVGDSEARNLAQATSGGAEAMIEVMRQALLSVRREEIARGMTVVGPHRDDLQFSINGVDAATYGSRGQQRTIALALKLAEIRLMEAQTGERPVLLLDDVLSELDQRRSEMLLGVISRADQVLITTTDLGHFVGEGPAKAFLQGASLWRIAEGTLSPIEPDDPQM